MDAGDLPLRDIHMPEAIGLWPPAPIWWVLIATIIVAAVVFGIFWARRTRVRRHALAQLLNIERNFKKTGDAQVFVSELSQLLRRVAISCNDRREVAALSSSRWLTWLDGDASDKPFSSGSGRLLAELPYRAPPVELSADDARALPMLVRGFIQVRTQ